MPKIVIRFVTLLLVPCLLADPATLFAMSRLHSPSPAGFIAMEQTTHASSDFAEQAITPFLEWVGVIAFYGQLTGRDRDRQLRQLPHSILGSGTDTRTEFSPAVTDDKTRVLAAFQSSLESDQEMLPIGYEQVLERWFLYAARVRNPDGTYTNATIDVYKKAGERLSSSWRANGLDTRIGPWNGIVFWKMLSHPYRDPYNLRNAYNRAVLFNQGSLEDQLIGYWTATTLLAHHIQHFGPHIDHGDNIDQELLERSLRALISLSVAWKKLHPAPRNLRDQRFLVYIEHTLARALDLSIYDDRNPNGWRSIYQSNEDESLAFPVDFYPAWLTHQISEFLQNISQTQATSAGVLYDEQSSNIIPEKDVNALLAPALARRNWQEEDLPPPLFDWDHLPPPIGMPITPNRPVGIFRIADPSQRVRPEVSEAFVNKRYDLQVKVFSTVRPGLWEAERTEGPRLNYAMTTSGTYERWRKIFRWFGDPARVNDALTKNEKAFIEIGISWWWEMWPRIFTPIRFWRGHSGNEEFGVGDVFVHSGQGETGPWGVRFRMASHTRMSAEYRSRMSFAGKWRIAGIISSQIAMPLYVWYVTSSASSLFLQRHLNFWWVLLGTVLVGNLVHMLMNVINRIILMPRYGINAAMTQDQERGPAPNRATGRGPQEKAPATALTMLKGMSQEELPVLSRLKDKYADLFDGSREASPEELTQGTKADLPGVADLLIEYLIKRIHESPTRSPGTTGFFFDAQPRSSIAMADRWSMEIIKITDDIYRGLGQAAIARKYDKRQLEGRLNTRLNRAA